MAFVRSGLTGWRLHASELPGKPDFYFNDFRLAVFVDGCFWHGCRRCGHTPGTRSDFWAAKFARNRERDLRNTKLLRQAGTRVIRFWEHQLKSPHDLKGAVKKVAKILKHQDKQECH